jgi:hypothetical protein
MVECGSPRRRIHGFLKKQASNDVLWRDGQIGLKIDAQLGNLRQFIGGYWPLCPAGWIIEPHPAGREASDSWNWQFGTSHGKRNRHGQSPQKHPKTQTGREEAIHLCVAHVVLIQGKDVPLGECGIWPQMAERRSKQVYYQLYFREIHSGTDRHPSGTVQLHSNKTDKV